MARSWRAAAEHAGRRAGGGARRALGRGLGSAGRHRELEARLKELGRRPHLTPPEMQEIAEHGFVLTPGRYVGAEDVEDDGEPFGLPDGSVVFLSARDGQYNVWRLDAPGIEGQGGSQPGGQPGGAARQLTKFDEFDLKFPSIGDSAIVFENGGWLWVMDLPSEKLTKISVQVPDDRPATRAELRNVSEWIGGMDLSPSAKRAAVEAHRFALADIGEAYALFGERRDGVLKVAITP